MNSAEAGNEVVFCNHCGTGNPVRSVVCCNCGHGHALAREVTSEPQKARSIEQWAWIALRLLCGLTICVGRIVPTGGTTLSSTLIASILGYLAVPVAIAAVLGQGNLARSSRWFLWVCLLLPIFHYAAEVIGRIHHR